MSFVKSPQELQKISQLNAEFSDAEMVFVFWLTSSEVVARLLPAPLEPAAIPLASAFIADYPRTNFSLPYREAALFLMVQYGQDQGSYCLSMPVTDDMAMASGRETFGFPKKLARIHLDQADDHIQGYAERNGIRFIELEFNTDEQSVPDNFKDLIQNSLAFHQPSGTPTYLFKSFAAPNGQGFDYPPRLVRQRTIFRPKTIEWGQAQVKLTPSNTDPWHEVEVVNLLGAMRIVGDNTMLSGEVVAEVDPQQFAPYAYNKWDW